MDMSDIAILILPLSAFLNAVTGNLPGVVDCNRIPEAANVG
jgi:hypothetical protein